MGKLLVILLLGAGAYYAYARLAGPSEITDPVYAEMRMDFDVGSRKITMVLYGKAADETDCRDRTERAWKKILDGCPTCKFEVVSCRRDLEPRYLRLFDNEIIHATYLSFTRGSRGERDGRLIFWGLTNAEGDEVCDTVRAGFQQRYSGQVRCVRGVLK
jgi:hypothetical protein